MKTYKGFKIKEGKGSYIIGNEKEGQIAPNDDVQSTTLKECKEVINNYLKKTTI